MGSIPKPPVVEARGPLTVQQIVARTGIPPHLVQLVVRRQPRRPG